MSGTSGQSINPSGLLKNLKWWQATIMIVSILLASGYAASQGVNVSVNIDLQARIQAIENRLDIPVNSSLSAFLKSNTYMVSLVDAYACLMNGYNAHLLEFLTNHTQVIDDALGNASVAGGSVYVAAGAYTAPGVTVQSNTRLIIETGATGITYTVASGATCIIDNFNGFDAQYYSAGVITADFNMASGNLLVLSVNMTSAYISSQIWMQNLNRTDVLANPAGSYPPFQDSWTNSSGSSVTDNGAWTNSSVASYCTLEVSDTIVSGGNLYSLHSIVAPASSGKVANVIKTISPAATTAYGSCNVYFSSFGDANITQNGLVRICKLAGNTVYGNSIACVAISNVSGVAEWVLHYREGNQVFHAVPVSSPLPQLNTWYSVECGGYVDSINGWSALWIDNVLVMKVTGLNNSAIGNVGSFQLGLPYANVNSVNAEDYVDDAVFSTSYIAVAPFSIPRYTTDPNTSGWGTSQQGRLWYNTVSAQYKYWNSTAVVVLGSGGPTGSGTVVHGLPFSNMVFENSTSNYMVNGTTGAIDKQSTNASAVINWATANLTSGRDYYQKVLVEGNYTVDSTPLLYNWTDFILDGKITMQNNMNATTHPDLIHQYSNPDSGGVGCSHIIVEGGVYDGNWQNGNSNSYGSHVVNYNSENGFYFEDASDITIKDVTMLNAGNIGFHFDSCSNYTLDHCTVKNSYVYCMHNGHDALSNDRSNITVTDCYMEGSLTDANNMTEGGDSIVAGGADSGYQIFSDDIFVDSSGPMLSIGGGSDPQITSVSGCTLSYAGGHAISASGQQVNIESNNVYNWGWRLNVTNNNVSQAYGIGAISTTGTCVIIGNTLNNTAVNYITNSSCALYGIRSYNTNTSTISLNTLYMANGTRGIYCGGDGFDTVIGNTILGYYGASKITITTPTYGKNVKDNYGYVTENSGAALAVVNGTWIPHGLDVTPSSPPHLTINGSDYINTTSYLIQPVVLAYNSTYFQVGLCYYDSHVDRLAGLTGTATFFDVAPTSLANITDGDPATVTGTGYRNFSSGSSIGIINYTMSAVYNLNAFARIGVWSNTSTVTTWIEYSADGVTWASMTGYGSASYTGTAEQNPPMSTHVESVTARYIRLRFAAGTTPISADVKIYDFEALDTSNSVFPVTGTGYTIMWSASG